MSKRTLPAYSERKKRKLVDVIQIPLLEIDENQPQMVSSSFLCTPITNDETDLELFLTPAVEIIKPLLSSPL